jgi:hypothetical protein
MNPTPTERRWAVYFAPAAQTDWWVAGRTWLGHCADTGERPPQPLVHGVPPEGLARLTATPARYGWHATLKAPFALRSGCTEDMLQQRLATLCAQHTAFTLPALAIQRMGHVLALMPTAPEPRLQQVANACVTGIQDLAAPLPATELTRRRAAGLSDRQEALLQAWGYPHVLDEFRFHFSLTGSLWAQTPAMCQAIEQAAHRFFDPLPPCRFDAVSLFVEEARDQPMRRVGQWALAAPAESAP